jgi:hypothetical protein
MVDSNLPKLKVQSSKTANYGGLSRKEYEMRKKMRAKFGRKQPESEDELEANEDL